MKSLYDFIVEPLGDKYSNTVNIDGKSLVLNTKIESFKFVNRLAKVIKTPLAFNLDIKVGDIVVGEKKLTLKFDSSEKLESWILEEESMGNS